MAEPITIAGAAGGALSALQYVNDFKQRVQNGAQMMDASMPEGADSLVAYTKPARAEPITLVDSRAVHLPYCRDVLQSLTSLYAGYYLQAVSLAVGIGRVNVLKLLDQFNPERSGPKTNGNYLLEQSLGKLARDGHLLTKESYEFGLPGLGGKAIGLEAYREALGSNQTALGELNVAIEAFHISSEAIHSPRVESNASIGGSTFKQEYQKNLKQGLDQGIADRRGNIVGKLGETKLVESSYGNKDATDIHEVPNLAVGKMLEVNVNDGTAKASFPVAVRLLVNSIDSQTLVHILGDGVKDSSTKERWHAWRSGAIGLADMLFAVDAIDAHRATLMKDKSGTYAEILRRRKENGLTTLRTGIAEGKSAVSIGTASNLVVITEETLKELERYAGIRFSNAAQRRAVFEMTYLMIVAVVDVEWEHVTFYTRGIALPSQLTVKQIQSSSKGSGPDITEILRAYKLGASPSL
jgi:hypothetical protein